MRSASLRGWPLFIGEDPEVRRPVQDIIGDRVEERVLAKGVKALKLRLGFFLLESAKDFVAGDGREGELVVLSQVRAGLLPDRGMEPLQNLGHHVCIEERQRHREDLSGWTGQVGPVEHDGLQVGDLLSRQTFVDVAPVGECIRVSGVIRNGRLCRRVA